MQRRITLCLSSAAATVSALAFWMLPAALVADPVLVTLNRASRDLIYYPEIEDPCETDLVRFGSGQRALRAHTLASAGRAGKALLVDSGYAFGIDGQVLLFERGHDGRYLEGMVQPGAMIGAVADAPGQESDYLIAWSEDRRQQIFIRGQPERGFEWHSAAPASETVRALTRAPDGGWQTLSDDGSVLRLRSSPFGSAPPGRTELAAWPILPGRPVNLAHLVDFDGDGDLDVFVAFGRELAVSLAQADATYSPLMLTALAATELVGSRLDFRALLADFDGDGRLDVLLVGHNGVYAANSLYLGDGAGNFPRMRYPALPSDSSRVAAGDVDGDGRVEVVQELQSGRFEILEIEPDGSYRFGASFAGPVGAHEVTLDDVDGDGDLDFIAASDNVAVYSGSGTGDFTPEQEISIGGSPLDLTAGVFDESGPAQVAVLLTGSPHPGSSRIKLLSPLGEKPERFGPPRHLTTIPQAAAIFTADFNGDGRLDLAANSTTGTIGLHLGSGDGEFGSARLTTAVGRVLAVADLDRDGLPDLVSRAPQGPEVAVFRGSQGGFAPAARLGAGRDPAATAVLDFDGDGWKDLAVADRLGSLVRLFRGLGDLRFELAEPPLESGGGPEKVLAGDLDGDGLDDLATLNVWTDDVSIFRRLASGGFRLEERQSAAGGVDMALVRMPRNPRVYEILVQAAGENTQTIHVLKAGPATKSGCSYFANPGKEPLRVIAVDFAGPHFQRGDANLDGAVAIDDAVAILFGVFLGQQILCPDAADANDSGRVDLEDALRLLLHLFRAGQGPAAPFPLPGPDPTPDGLGPCLPDGLTR